MMTANYGNIMLLIGSRKQNAAKDFNFTLFIVRGKLYFSINKNSTLDPFSTFRYFLHKKLY